MAAQDVESTAAELRLVVGQLVRQIRAETTRVGGLPLPQAAILGWLDREGPMTTSELAAVQAVRHQSAARVVGQLVDLGMVELSAHPTDGRKQIVTLAPAGLAALQARREQRVGSLAEAIDSRLSPAEQRALARGVDLMARLVDH